ncbi:MAG: helix-turn-helix transcriptional regulator [Clostridia bacterium]|nr:helix-turn-helix transcriptional regulator [Clostridia bacterium]
MENLTYQDILNRIRYFRNRANMSGSKVSAAMGFNPQYIKRVETNKLPLRLENWLDYCEIVGITPQEFFYLGKGYSEDDRSFFELFSKLSTEDKHILVELMKKLATN